MKVLFIAQRELGALLGSIVGWLVITAFTFICGVATAFGMVNYAESSKQIVELPYTDIQLTFADYLLWQIYSFEALFLMFVVPAVTMRLFSEELRNKTLELLMTAPLSLWELVAGKFLGAMGFVTLMLLFASWHIPLLLMWTSVDPVVLFSGLGATWLVAACLVVLGMACSAATPHQLLALVMAEGIAFGILMLSAFEEADPTGILQGLSLFDHMEDLAHGLLRLSDLTFFVVFILVGLLATQQRLALRRWS